MTASAPLNLFQRLLRQWEHAHPYNAAQAMHLRGSADQSAITAAWLDTLCSMGLGKLLVTGGGYQYQAVNAQYRNRPVPIVPSHRSLAEFLSDQLNSPFDDPEEPPFRPFIRRGEDGYHLGVVYQHWVADSISIRMLLREWFYRLYDPAAACKYPIRQPDRGYWRLFGPDNSNWHLIEGAISTFRRYFRYRRVKKVDSAGIDNAGVAVRLESPADATIDRVYRYARMNGVKVNDVFVAAMASLCWQYVPLQLRARRTDIAIGSIVDLRPFSHSRLDEVFSIFLGFNSVVCTPRELADWKSLLMTVHKQNSSHRNSGMIQSSLLWMISALMVGRFVRPDKLYHFYRKEVPLAGGVSNVVLNNSWATKYHPDPILSYLRVSPPGPMTPVVFTTTTLGSNLQLGITYRKSLMDGDRVTSMCDGFFERMNSLV